MDNLSLSTRDSVSFGDPYQTAAGFLAVDSLSVAPAVNLEDLTVRMRVSTDFVDRDRMVIWQPGIDTEYYISNPVVLFGHGEQGISLPVAISENEYGQCTVWRDENSTWAIAHHNKDDKTSMQIFDLVVKKMLRASSIGLTPKPGGIVVRTVKSERVPFVEGSWMNEWSYCSVPVNPQALIKSYGARRVPNILLEETALQSERASAILSSNRLDGAPILEPIKKALMGLVPGKSIQVRGSSMLKKSLTKQQLKAMTRNQLFKAFTSKDEYDEESKKNIDEVAEESFSKEDSTGEKPPAAGSEKPVESADKPADSAGGDMQQSEPKKEGDGSEPAEVASDSKAVNAGDNVDEGGEEKPEMNPPGVDQADLPGSVAVRAGHDILKAAVDAFRAEFMKVEQPDLKAKVEPELDKILESLAIIAEAHDSQYPQAPSIASGAMDEEVEILKSMFKTNPRRSISASHIARTFQEQAKNLKSGRFDAVRIAKSLAEYSGHLQKMIAESSGLKVVSVEQYQSALAEIDKWKNVAKKADAVLQRLDSQPERV